MRKLILVASLMVGVAQAEDPVEQPSQTTEPPPKVIVGVIGGRARTQEGIDYVRKALAAMSDDEVCNDHGTNAEDRFFSFAEIKRRKLFKTAAEYAEVKRGGIRIGMQKHILMCSYGIPEKTNTTVTARGVTEQLVYRYGTHVYLENNRVTGFQLSQ